MQNVWPTALNLGGNVSDDETGGKHIPNVAFTDVSKNRSKNTEKWDDWRKSEAKEAKKWGHSWKQTQNESALCKNVVEARIANKGKQTYQY